MRIAYDASPLLAPLTGVGHYCSSLLKGLLKESDLEITLFAMTIQSGPIAPMFSALPLKRYGIPGRIGTTLWTMSGFPAGELMTGQSDVVHGTNFWIPPIEARNGIVTIHDLTFHFFPEMCTPQIQRYRWMVPKVLQRCALVITPSSTVKEQVASELGFDSDRIVQTPEGVRGAFVGATRDAELMKRLGINSRYLLFAGTQEPRKNLAKLIEAFRLVSAKESDLQLLIAGPPGWGSVDLPGVVTKLGIRDRVVFSGYLTDEELGAAMVGASAFVFPTLYEGFGLPPLEAMAAGIPVVASRVGSLPEVLGEAPYWCDPSDVESIADAISAVIVADTRRSLAIEEGKKQASLYSWEQTASKTIEAYRIVASLTR